MRVAVVPSRVLALAVSRGESCYSFYLLAIFAHALFLRLYASCRYTLDVRPCLGSPRCGMKILNPKKKQIMGPLLSRTLSDMSVDTLISIIEMLLEESVTLTR